MCGITGEVRFDAKADRMRVLQMTAALDHRGPDAESTYFDQVGTVAFGFRRLAIVDLSTGGQPIGNEDGKVVSMLNGEIYNHRDLRIELSSLGHRFATDHADSEVIPHGYEEWGVGIVDHLRGMFAIALWDARRNRLLLARDRLGEKPLYYRPVGHGIRFSSELQPLIEDRDEVDAEALALYLTYQYVPAPSTILKGVQKLEPGELIEFGEIGLARRRYWTVAGAAATANATTAEQVTALIEQAVLQRCEADVPIGSFLSGGVDSSVTTALLARSTGRQVHTFSFGFTESRLDETDAAQRVASLLGTSHHVVRADSTDVAAIERAVASIGEPLADAAAVPTYLLSEVASESVKVVLTGEGADELFGGYARYLYQHRMRRLLSAPLAIRRLGATGLRRASQVDRRVPARLADLLDAPHSLQAREWRAVMPRWLRVSLLPGLIDLESDPVLRAAAASAGNDDMAASFATDLATWVPDDLLVKVDRTTMAHGLEARPPFLDHVLVEAVLGLPPDIRWTPGRDKPLLRDFAAGFLPLETANRRKQTFTTPTDAWLQGPLRISNAEATAALLDFGFDPGAVQNLQRRSLGGNRDRGQWAWVTYVLGRWLIANPSISSRVAA